MNAYVEGINAYVAARQHRPPRRNRSSTAQLGKPIEDLETDRRDRDRLADRRHLRPRRRQRAALGPDHAGLPGAFRQEGRAARPGSASAPRTTPKRRPRSRRSSPTRPKAPSPSAAWRCPKGRVNEPPIAKVELGASPSGGRSFGDLIGRAAARRRARLELGAGLRQALRRRPPDRRPGAAGRLLRARDPDGGGPARPRHRRPRRRLRGGQPGGRARPRHRLRLERDDRDLRQRRHLRRGALQGQRPLPLPRQVQADGKAGQDGEMGAERDRLDRSRRTDPDRLPDGARHRLRPRQGRTARRSPSSTIAAPTSTRPTRCSASRGSTNPVSSPGSPASKRRSRKSASSSTGPTSTPNTSPTRSPATCRSGRREPRPTSRSSGPASSTGRASSRRPGPPPTCRSPSTRRPSTPTISSPGTTSRRRNGRRPTTSTATARSSARS